MSQHSSEREASAIRNEKLRRSGRESAYGDLHSDAGYLGDYDFHQPAGPPLRLALPRPHRGRLPRRCGRIRFGNDRPRSGPDTARRSRRRPSNVLHSKRHELRNRQPARVSRAGPGSAATCRAFCHSCRETIGGSLKQSRSTPAEREKGRRIFRPRILDWDHSWLPLTVLEQTRLDHLRLITLITGKGAEEGRAGRSLPSGILVRSACRARRRSSSRFSACPRRGGAGSA